MIGTFINVAAVIVGSSIGLFFNNKIPKQVLGIVFTGLGIITLVLGFQMAFKTENILLIIFSILIGGIIGEVIKLDKHLENLANHLKRLVKSKSEHFTEGLITAFILFCIGPLTIIGSLNDGLRGDYSLLLTKSMLDGFTSIAFASTFGIGVLFSAIPMLIFQGTITLSASFLKNILTDQVISELTATGGILIIATGMNVLELKKIRVANFLPALIVIVLLTILIAQYA